jgi:hypothetical protein
MRTQWVVGTVLALGFATATAQTSPPPPNHPADQIQEAAGLVSPRGPDDKAWFRTIRSDQSGVKTPARETMQKRAGVTRTKTSFTLVDNLHVIEVPAGMVPQVLQKLLDEEDVLYAEPDYDLQFLTTPNDPEFADQWGLRNTGQTVNGDPGTAGADVRATAAWDTWTGDPNFVIASIDSGVELTHSDLAANIWLNPGEIPSNGVDDDGNGYIDDRVGWDFINNDNDPSPSLPAPIDRHGTLTSGVFGAVGNNAKGLTGVNWRCKVAVLGTDRVSHLTLALEYCVRKNIRVSNFSLGQTVYVQSEYDAIAEAAEAGHILVTVAGNNVEINGDVLPFFPGTHKLPNIINVLATDNDDQLAGTYGATTVDLGAPGSNVLSTTLGGNYDYASGSSMSAPMVAGTCGLLLSKYPSLDYRQVVGRIIKTARPVAALSGKCVSGGVLDINQALNGDCDNDGTPDLQEVVSGTQADCNMNGIPDNCDGPDCDSNGIPDSCDLEGFTGIYQNHTLFSYATYTRIDAAIDFDWGTGSPIPGVTGVNGFRVRWEGTIVPQFSETYTFYVAAPDVFGRDGVRLEINGQRLIDAYPTATQSEHSGSIALTAGIPCRVVLEYLQALGDASIHLSWSSPSLPKQIIQLSTQDCNRNGLLDSCELPGNDCNDNGVIDSCDVATGGASVDCDSNGVVDSCELVGRDCNSNGVIDSCDVATGGSAVDCDGNGVLDTCELATRDCNHNGIVDDCDLATGGTGVDCDGNSVLDACELIGRDCNSNGKIDSCDLAAGGASVDCDGNDVLDTCELAGRDCNNNGMVDDCDLATGGAAVDCDGNSVLDSCELATNDCNSNGVVDACEIPSQANQYYAKYPPENLGSHMTANGAASLDDGGTGFGRIWLHTQGAGSANFTEPTAALATAFEASFLVYAYKEQSTPADAAFCFSFYDASQNGPNLLFGSQGPAGNSLTFSLVYHSSTNHRCELRHNGAVIGTFVPTIPLVQEPWGDDGRTWIRTRFLDGRMSIILTDEQSGATETAFDALLIPGFTPYPAHFGFGASGLANTSFVIREISVAAVTFLAPNIRDCNSNLVPDQCEADCDSDGMPDDCELAASAAFSANFDTPQGSAYALNGSASILSGAARLTPPAQNSTGTLIFEPVTPAPIEAFTASFDFMMGGGSTGDGMSFSLLDAAAQSSNAIFGELGPPLALTLGFDTFQNPGQPNDNRLTLRYQGIDLAHYSPAFDLNNAQWHHASVSLEAGAVTVILTPAGGSSVTAFNAVSIPGFTPRSGRFGFGARTGASTDAHWIDNVSISASLAHSQDANANDIPDECETDCDNNGISDVYQRQASAGHFIEFNATGDTFWTANGSTSVAGGQMRLTPAQASQTGTLVMPETPGYVTAFEASFRFKIGAGDGTNGADGLSFTMMDADVFSATASFGETGPGPQALTLKFDTFQNAGDVDGNHIALLYNGATLAIYTPAFTLNDNVERSVLVRFSDGLITVVLNDTMTAFDNVSVPGYVPMLARFAFGARTGGFNNEHWVDGIFINAHMPALSDCDSNGLPDGCEMDCNANGVPDACGSIGSGAYVATFQGSGDTPYRLSGSGAIASNDRLELTPAQPSRVGTLVFEPVSPVPVEGFTASFDFNMGPGDGFSLALLDVAYWGSDCLFGETGPPQHALTIEFDTFNNGGDDLNGNHITIWYNGAVVATANAGFLLASGAWNHAVVTLAGGAVTVTWTASLPNHTATILNAVPIPGFTPVAGRFGLGARNGGFFSVHGFDNVAITTDMVQLETDPDDDGVPDGCDACPGTIPGFPVDATGCPPLIPGDFDRDGDVDTTDVNAFAACASGPTLPLTPGCEAKDLDADDDTDQSDFSLLQRCYSGANRPASPGCAN